MIILCVCAAILSDGTPMPAPISNTILLSDTNYEPTAHNHLILLIEKFINKGSTIILSTPNRLASNPFIESVSKYIDRSKNYCITEIDTRTEILVMVLKK